MCDILLDNDEDPTYGYNPDLDDIEDIIINSDKIWLPDISDELQDY